MANKIGVIGGAAALFCLVGGYAPAARAEVPRLHCGVISHPVANLNAVNPRHAYWCKSDVAGYLGEDHAVRIEPYRHYWPHHHWRRRVVVTDR